MQLEATNNHCTAWKDDLDAAGNNEDEYVNWLTSCRKSPFDSEFTTRAGNTGRKSRFI